METRGCVWVGGKFLKPWQVRDKIIDWIFIQFIFNLLQMTETKEKMTCMVLKTQEWIQGDVYVWGKVI